MNSKQRAFLRSLANNITSIFQVGKNGISENLIKQVDDALEARELIKLNVLETSPDDIEEVANSIAEKTNSTLVQIMGNKITLYRTRKKIQRLYCQNSIFSVRGTNFLNK